MSSVLPLPAPWIDGLPRDVRGFVVPAEAGWKDGTPVLAKVGQDRKVALGMRRACGVCGFVMPKGRAVYRAFAQVDAAHIRLHEREQAHDDSGPLHLSCVLYSAMVCPYLRERTARMSKTGINPGGRRGTRAAVIGFAGFGLLVPMHMYKSSQPAMPKFAYVQMVEDIPYVDGADLADHYEAAVRSDRNFIDMSVPRMFWTGEEPPDLKRALRADVQAISRRAENSEFVYTQMIEHEGEFGALPL